MRGFLLAVAIVLVGCTGQNVDESFVATHGALLARATCSEGVSASPVSGRHFTFDALMFLDSSVLVHGTGDTGGFAFYERSDSSRAHARVDLGQYESNCSGTRNYAEINSGSLELIECTGTPASYQVMHSMTLSSDCTGFNKSLFN